MWAVTTGPLPRIVAVVVTFNRLACSSGWSSASARSTAWPRCWSSTTPPPTARGSGWPPARPPARSTLRGRTLTTNRGGAGGFHDGLAWAIDSRGRPGVADGRRRPARPRLPDSCCWATTTTSTSGARSWSTRPSPDRLVFPIRLPGSTKRRARGRRRTPCRARRPHRRHRHPVQRRAGHQGARRPDRPAARGVLHLGRRPRVPPARRGGRSPRRDRRHRDGAAPQRRQPRHADDVRQDDLQRLAERPQALLHGPQQPGQPPRLPRARSTPWPSW